MDKFKNSSFGVFFIKFPSLIAAGLIFSGILAFSLFLSILAGRLTGFNNLIVYSLGLIPATMFLPGLVMIVRKYAVEKSFVPVVSTFFSAVRNNIKQFIFHSFIMYLITACSTFAIIYYGLGSFAGPVFGMVFIIYILFVLILTIAMFYLPLMAVTYELRFRDLYKNSILLVFGTILRNIAALFYAAVLSFLALLFFLYTNGVFRYISLAVIIVLYPLMLCYGVIPLISKGVQENVGHFVGVEAAPKNEVTEEDKAAAMNIRSDGDYVFVNGKMIKNPNKEADNERSI